MYRLEYDGKPFLKSPRDLTEKNVPDSLVRETARLLFETGHFGDVKSMRYEPILYFHVMNGKMEGTMPDLYMEMMLGNPIVLEASGIIPETIPTAGHSIDPKERQKRVMAAQGLDYRVLYGGDILNLQEMYPGYSFTLKELPNTSLYVAAA